MNWRALELVFPRADLSHRVCHSGDIRKGHGWRKDVEVQALLH